MSLDTVDLAPPEPTTGEHVQVSWRKPLGMTGLSFFNFFLRILTLGIYDFWGRTEVRKRIWSAVRLNDEPLIYTGTGMELFLGFLIVFGIFLLPLMLATVGVILYFGPESPYIAVFQLVVSVVVFFLIGIAIYRAQRYRLARTHWRGIRGGLFGSSLNYGWTFFWTAMLIPMTLGWIVPWRTTELQKIMTNDTRFGDRPFTFRGSAGPLYGRFAVLWVGTLLLYIAAIVAIVAAVFYVGSAEGFDFSDENVDENISEGGKQIIGAVTIAVFVIAFLVYGLFSAWYRAKVFNYFASATHFENAQFRGTVTGWGLIWLGITNFLIIIFSLFILLPVVQARTARYFIEHLELVGSVPVEEIAQGAQQDLKTGEGLAQAFDVDAF